MNNLIAEKETHKFIHQLFVKAYFCQNWWFFLLTYEGEGTYSLQIKLFELDKFLKLKLTQ